MKPIQPRFLLKLVAVLGLLALLWTAGVGWWLPRFLQPRIETAASEALGAPLSLGTLAIAPWRLEARIGDLRLGPAEAPWLVIKEILADASIESVWRLAPVLERLELDAPQVDLVRESAGRFNVSPLLEALSRPSDSPTDDTEPTRFAVHNIRVEGGRLHFTDRVAGSEHRIEALRVGVPFVSNLPSYVELQVQPLLEAEVNGSRLQLTGRTQPFEDAQRSSLDIDWREVDVPRWFEALAPLLPQPVPVALSSGRLDLALTLDFERRTASEAPLLRLAGDATLSQLQLSAEANGLALALERLSLEDLELLPLERRVAVGRVGVQAPAVDLDLPRLMAMPAGRAEAAEEAPADVAGDTPPADAWRWRIAAVELAEGRVRLSEPAWPAGELLAPIRLELTGLDAATEAPPATLKFALSDARGATFTTEGTLAVAAREAALQLTLAGLQPKPWLAPWQAKLPVAWLEGQLAAEGALKASPDGAVLEAGSLQLTGVQLRPAAAAALPGLAPDRLSLRQLDVDGIALQAKAGAPLAVQVKTLALDRFDLRAVRAVDGRLGWWPGNAAGEGGKPNAAAAGPAPRWRVDELRCKACAVALSDRGVSPPVTLGLARTDVTLRGLGDDFKQPVAFDFGAQALGGGRLGAKGTLRPQPLALKSRIDIAALDLRALQPYLEPHVNVVLASAKASLAGELNLEGSTEEPVAAARWRGRAALGEVRALDRINDAEFLRFKNLQIEGSDIGWRAGALQADLGAVALEDFYGRLIVNADGRLNLLDVRRQEGEEGRSLTTPDAQASAAPRAAASAPIEPVPSAASAPQAAQASEGDRPQLRWQGIRLAGGSVDFTDNFIRPNYSAKLTEIGGEVEALAWDNPQPAAVRIAGKVDGSAPLEIVGTVHPLGPRLATDITASARGVDITRLTAYSARYAGYGIEKGTLSVKVRYRIENGQLQAENNVYLDQLTFGERVESPDAVKLPVLLAVALLKDRNGVIDIDLPISGSLDDPQFSVGGIIVRVIVNLIVKAVTAPFALLASAFGGGEELGFVEFASGSSELNEASQRRLDALAKALDGRPALKLEATGRADAALDEAALRARHLDRLMRVAKAKASGELAESVSIEPAERARWLEVVYKATELKDKPRNAIGLAKSVPPEEMEARLLAAAPVGEAELRALADQRGDRVKSYLVGKVDPERVLLTASKLGGEGVESSKEEGPATKARVDFALK